MRVLVVLTALAAVERAAAASHAALRFSRRSGTGGAGPDSDEPSGSGVGGSGQGSSKQHSGTDASGSQHDLERLLKGIPPHVLAGHSGLGADSRSDAGSSSGGSDTGTVVAHEHMARLHLGGPDADPSRSGKPWKAGTQKSDQTMVRSTPGHTPMRPLTKDDEVIARTRMVEAVREKRRQGASDFYQRQLTQSPHDPELQKLARVERELDGWKRDTEIMSEGGLAPKTKLSRKQKSSKMAALERLMPSLHEEDPRFAAKLAKIMADSKDPRKRGTLSDNKMHDLMATLEEDEGELPKKFATTSKHHFERSPARERLAQAVRDRQRKAEMEKQGMRGEQYAQVLADEPTRRREALHREFDRQVHGEEPAAAERAAREARARAKMGRPPLSKAELQQIAQGRQKAPAEAGGAAEQQQQQEEGASQEELERAQRKREKMQRKYAKKKEKKTDRQPETEDSQETKHVASGDT